MKLNEYMLVGVCWVFLTYFLGFDIFQATLCLLLTIIAVEVAHNTDCAKGEKCQ